MLLSQCPQVRPMAYQNGNYSFLKRPFIIPNQSFNAVMNAGMFNKELYFDYVPAGLVIQFIFQLEESRSLVDTLLFRDSTKTLSGAIRYSLDQGQSFKSLDSLIGEELSDAYVYHTLWFLLGIENSIPKFLEKNIKQLNITGVLSYDLKQEKPVLGLNNPSELIREAEEHVLQLLKEGKVGSLVFLPFDACYKKKKFKKNEQEIVILHAHDFNVFWRDLDREEFDRPTVELTGFTEGKPDVLQLEGIGVYELLLNEDRVTELGGVMSHKQMSEGKFKEFFLPCDGIYLHRPDVPLYAQVPEYDGDGIMPTVVRLAPIELNVNMTVVDVKLDPSTRCQYKVVPVFEEGEVRDYLGDISSFKFLCSGYDIMLLREEDNPYACLEGDIRWLQGKDLYAGDVFSLELGMELVQSPQGPELDLRRGSLTHLPVGKTKLLHSYLQPDLKCRYCNKPLVGVEEKRIDSFHELYECTNLECPYVQTCITYSSLSIMSYLTELVSIGRREDNASVERVSMKYRMSPVTKYKGLEVVELVFKVMSIKSPVDFIRRVEKFKNLKKEDFIAWFAKRGMIKGLLFEDDPLSIDAVVLVSGMFDDILKYLNGPYKSQIALVAVLLYDLTNRGLALRISDSLLRELVWCLDEDFNLKDVYNHKFYDLKYRSKDLVKSGCVARSFATKMSLGGVIGNSFSKNNVFEPTPRQEALLKDFKRMWGL